MTAASGRRLRAVGEEFIARTHALFPQVGSQRGDASLDGELGENDAATHRQFAAVLSSTLRAVETLPDFALTGDDWLDRRGFLALLRTELFFNATFPHWQINPQTHCGEAIDAIFNLVIRNPDDLASKRAAIESRLAQLPRFLAQGAACLRRPVPLWTRLARQTCDGARTFFEAIGSQLVPLSARPQKTAELIQNAIAALQRYAAAAEAKQPGAVNGFSVGREHFEYLIRERLGFPLTVDEAEAQGLALAEQLRAQLAAEAKQFGRGKTAGAILATAAARWQPSTRLAAEYGRATADLRQRFQNAGFATFPQRERCLVLPVPKFLRHSFPTAAYSQPGAFARDQTGQFWVNDFAEDLPAGPKRDAEVQQHFGIELTSAHEAYPGHHLQFVIQNQHPSRLRRLMHHAIGYEGWTLWCEKQAIELGIVAHPEARLGQLHDALWRAHRIVIDCGLHSGKLSYAAAARRLQEGVGFTAARARADVNWYTSSPTVPMSYLLGRLENERLHAQLVGREGWTLRQFNDWLLSHGALPQRWIWEARLHTEKGCNPQSAIRTKLE